MFDLLKKKKYISYDRFKKMMVEIGDDATDEDTTVSILLEFYLDDKRHFNYCIAEFHSLITKSTKYNLKLNLDFENMPANYFITADIYFANSDILSLFNHLSGKKELDISVQKANQTKVEFLKSVAHFKQKYVWIYDPPSFPNTNNKPTIGKQLRNEFVQNYGMYSEITYLIANGDSLKFEKINELRLENYLSLGEYLLRKKTVENIE